MGNQILHKTDLKLVEEAQEVCEANRRHEIIEELADVLEVIDGMCRAYGIDFNEIVQAKKEKHQKRGGFETGMYVESLTMSEDNPRINYFRSSPHKYPELEL